MSSVGIIGAGQLSQMLVQAGEKSGVRVHVLAGSKTESAAREPGAEVTVGTPSDAKTLREFLSKVSVCGFESELVDCAALKKAAMGLPVRFVPDLGVMDRLSEKIQQKRFLRNLGIPTAPFFEFDPATHTLDSWIEMLKERFGMSFVIKWSKFGYDGRGVLLIHDEGSLGRAKASAKVAIARGVQLYAESRVKFVRELAVIGCHSTNGDFAAYPLVISEQEHGICRRVRGPAVSFGVKDRFERLAVQYAEKIAKTLPLHGAFGIEFFETPEGDLWVNEIAPRVHNSGHYSQDAGVGAEACDQFENHLRALTGQMLGRTQMRPYFAMLNLLGPHGAQGTIESKGPISKILPDPAPGITLHWYNKDEVFPGRKLGHLNCAADSLEELSDGIARMEAYEAGWVKALAGVSKGGVK